jgi:hypothetical protein
MKLKVEKVPFPVDAKAHGISNETFVITARDLEVGESFEFEGFGPYQRNALSVLQYAYGREYASRKVSASAARIFRVA